ncbi:hypothetical protein STEG23_006397, partial [Scotinomys teguina]
GNSYLTLSKTLLVNEGHFHDNMDPHTQPECEVHFSHIHRSSLVSSVWLPDDHVYFHISTIRIPQALPVWLPSAAGEILSDDNYAIHWSNTQIDLSVIYICKCGKTLGDCILLSLFLKNGFIKDLQFHTE